MAETDSTQPHAKTLLDCIRAAAEIIIGVASRHTLEEAHVPFNVSIGMRGLSINDCQAPENV